MKIEDNFLEQKELEQLQKTMLGPTFTWNFGKIDTNNDVDNFHFVHLHVIVNSYVCYLYIIMRLFVFLIYYLLKVLLKIFQTM